MSSDISKAEKLAAARKKLKEFQSQQKNKDNVVTASQPMEYTIQTNINRSTPEFSQVQEPPSISAVFNVPNSEAPAIRTDGQLPSISNYFSDTNKNNFLFETVSKYNSIITKSTTPPDFNFSNSPSPHPVATTPTPTETVSFSPISVHHSSTHSLYSEPVEKLPDSKYDPAIEALKRDLAQAENKIRMQAEALDIITAERGDVQMKLQSALKEIETYRVNVSVLQNELHKSSEQQQQFNQLVQDLRSSNETTSRNSQTLEQNINDLRERNEELEQLLKLQVERNSNLQKQLDETQSHHDMLVLKFQQLGIETSQENNDYKVICEELNSMKRKYAELEEQSKTLAYEKEHTNNEYHQYVQNLQEELHQTKEEMLKLFNENQQLVEKISSQTEHISSLEKMLQKPPPPPPPTEESDNQLLTDLKNEIQNLKEEKEKEKQQYEAVMIQVSDYDEWKHKAISLEENLEALKNEMMNIGELQKEIESNKVAASQAISQNNKLKTELERLNNLINAMASIEDIHNAEKQTLQQHIEKIDEEKEMLRTNLEESKIQNTKLLESQNQSEADAAKKNDVAINTDAQEGSEVNGYGKTNIIAMQQLQEKFKSVLDKMADLTDEKQQLEHLVMQLQSETETIEEYVALYQKQKSILQQKARETDLQMKQVGIERQRLLNIIHSILTGNISDSNVIKELIQQNLSIELTNELNLQNGGPAVSNGFSLYDPSFNNDDSKHHPSCSCCSGKLITI
ncbi:hypothetical protein V9T40_003793 [Parthenolecanium corni]|uniref:Golgin subfamily A conserved domain-containing protein n=1 Tax=Parthenolecanium corni TaxID=536013 RepID=A0AAN9U1G7_9HEMI